MRNLQILRMVRHARKQANTHRDIATTGLNWPRADAVKMQTNHIIIFIPGCSHFALRPVGGGTENTVLAGKVLNPIPANSLAAYMAVCIVASIL